MRALPLARDSYCTRPQVRQLAEAKQAELNAKLLQLESHIHWLQQDNDRLQTLASQAREAGSAAAQQQNAAVAASAAGMAVSSSLVATCACLAALACTSHDTAPAFSFRSPPPPPMHAADTCPSLRAAPALRWAQARVSSLESELRKSKRAEQKLQALLYRLRQDVAGLQGGNAGLFESLQDVRSLEYEVDFLTNKLKVTDREPALVCRRVALLAGVLGCHPR